MNIVARLDLQIIKSNRFNEAQRREAIDSFWELEVKQHLFEHEIKHYELSSDKALIRRSYVNLYIDGLLVSDEGLRLIGAPIENYQTLEDKISGDNYDYAKEHEKWSIDNGYKDRG